MTNLQFHLIHERIALAYLILLNTMLFQSPPVFTEALPPNAFSMPLWPKAKKPSHW
jgi:hypothetical protein